MKEQWRKEMQRKLSDYRRPAPELRWDDIEKCIVAQRKPADFVFTKVKRMAVAAAIALLAVGTAFVALQQHKEGADKTLAARSKRFVNKPSAYKDNQTKEEAQTHLSNLSTDAAASSLCASAERKTNRGLASVEKHGEDVVATPKENSALLSTERTQEVSSQRSDIAARHAEGTSTTPRQLVESGVNARTIAPEMTNVTKRVKTLNNLTAGVFMSNVMTSDNQMHISGPALAKAEPIGDYDHTMTGTAGSFVTENLSNIKTEVRHRQPVRFGASLRYRFNERWSVQGGLSYTTLSSTLIRELQSYSLETEQHLTYVGIPLSVNYRIWGNKHFGVYASAGGTIEKMVRGRRKMSYIVGGTAETVDRTNVRIKELQYALNGSMGIEYNFDRRFSLYAEPGLSYYFANPSDIPTIYKEKPLNFHLNLGVRFNLK